MNAKIAEATHALNRIEYFKSATGLTGQRSNKTENRVQHKYKIS